MAGLYAFLRRIFSWRPKGHKRLPPMRRPSEGEHPPIVWIPSGSMAQSVNQDHSAHSSEPVGGATRGISDAALLYMLMQQHSHEDTSKKRDKIDTPASQEALKREEVGSGYDSGHNPPCNASSFVSDSCRFSGNSRSYSGSSSDSSSYSGSSSDSSSSSSYDSSSSSDFGSYSSDSGSGSSSD